MRKFTASGEVNGVPEADLQELLIACLTAIDDGDRKLSQMLEATVSEVEGTALLAYLLTIQYRALELLARVTGTTVADQIQTLRRQS